MLNNKSTLVDCNMDSGISSEEKKNKKVLLSLRPLKQEGKTRKRWLTKRLIGEKNKLQ